MTLDINTLLVVTVANIVVLAIISPAVMGRNLGRAASFARWSLAVHAVSWVCMITSNFWPETWVDRLLSTASIAGFAGTHWLLFRALEEWLGPRMLRWGVVVLAVLAPVGYFLSFDTYAFRVGWSNLLLAMQLLLLSLACFGSRTAIHGRWRLVVAFAMLIMAGLTAGRGYLGAFTDMYPSFLTPHPWNVMAMAMTSLVPLMVNFAVLGGWHEEAENTMHQQAITDSLTGLLNRRGWGEVASPLVANSNRYDLPVALLMLDIDFFKKINDSFGHDAGDRALRAIGSLLQESCRASDVAARIGGEEFCLLLPGGDYDAACNLDQRLRQKLPEISRQLGYFVDFSTGLALHAAGESLERLMTRADSALYQAKDSGRGRLMVADNAMGKDLSGARA